MSCNKFSVYETHWVTHLVMIMFTEGCKDTVTLLLFQLPVIWECSVLPVGNAFLQAAALRQPGRGSEPQEDHRRPKDDAVQPPTGKHRQRPWCIRGPHTVNVRKNNNNSDHPSGVMKSSLCCYHDNNILY